MSTVSRNSAGFCQICSDISDYVLFALRCSPTGIGNAGIAPPSALRSSQCVARLRCSLPYAIDNTSIGINTFNRPSHLRHDLLGQDLQLVERERIRHAGPMDRGDDVVDAEAAVQPDHLLGDLRRRAQQETVLQQFVEFVVEIVALRASPCPAPSRDTPCIFLRDRAVRGGSPRRGSARRTPRGASALRSETACRIRRARACRHPSGARSSSSCCAG